MTLLFVHVILLHFKMAAKYNHKKVCKQYPHISKQLEANANHQFARRQEECLWNYSHWIWKNLGFCFTFFIRAKFFRHSSLIFNQQHSLKEDGVTTICFEQNTPDVKKVSGMSVVFYPLDTENFDFCFTFFI